MALNLSPLLKKGTYHRVRGVQDHLDDPNRPKYSWPGIDDGAVVGTQGYAPDDGKTSHWEKKITGGGWNFRFNLTKYPGWFFWLGHNSQIPLNNKTFKRGDKMFKTGKTGGVPPHLHYSLLYKGTPKDPDNPNVVKWGVEDEVTELESKVASFIYLYRAIFNIHPNATMKKYFLYLAKKGTDPAAWSRNKYLTPLLKKDYVTKLSYEKALQYAQDQYEKVSGQRLDNHKIEIGLLQEDIKGLKEEIKTFKEPTTVKIPRVTKFDNLWGRMWKRLLQIIAR